MSHFSVLVACKSVEEIDSLLAPYDENIEMPLYKERIEGKPSDHWAWRLMTREHGYEGPDEWAPYIAAYKSRRSDGDQPEDSPILDEEGPYTWSTYNPQSKWDWYSIGGRWSGYFKVKPEYEGDKALGIGEPGAFDNVPAPGRVDYGPKSMLDLDGMRREKAEAAEETYDSVAKAIEGTPEATPWADFVARVHADEITIDQARELYRIQPRVEAFNGWVKEQGYFLADLENYDMPREQFVERARAGAVPGFACLIDGQWYEPGKMGWFGMSTETPSTQAGYWEHVNGLIDALPDDAVLVAVDCHI